MLTLLIAFSLALIPFICIPSLGEGIRTPKEIVSILSMVGIIFTSVKYYHIRPFKNKWLLLFGGWCFLTLLLSNYPLSVYLDKGIVLAFPSNMMAWKSLLYITLSILTIVCISGAECNSHRNYSIGGFSVLNSENHSIFDIKVISKLISWIALILCFYATLQVFGIEEWFRVADNATGWVGKSIWDVTANTAQTGSISHRIVATLGNPAILGIFLSIIAVFPLSLKNRFGYLVFSLLCGIVLLTQSTTAFIALIISISFYLLFKNPKTLLALIVVSLLCSPIIYSKVQSHIKDVLNPTGRFEVLKESWTELYKKPITGLGLGTFEHIIGGNPEHVKNLNNQSWKEAHNEFWQIGFETGIIGLILFLMFVFTSFFKMGNPVYGAALVGFLIACITYFPMRIAPLSFYGVIITGLFLNKGE